MAEQASKVERLYRPHGHLVLRRARALRSIAEMERDRDTYLRHLLSEARYTKDDGEKAKLLHEAGRIHQEERDDPDAAARLYEEALRKGPDFLPAARPLADLYVTRSDWPRAEAVLDVVVKRLAQDGEAKELCRQSYRLSPAPPGEEIVLSLGNASAGSGTCP